jgi:hypothetical protein
LIPGGAEIIIDWAGPDLPGYQIDPGRVRVSAPQRPQVVAWRESCSLA